MTDQQSLVLPICIILLVGSTCGAPVDSLNSSSAPVDSMDNSTVEATDVPPTDLTVSRDQSVPVDSTDAAVVPKDSSSTTVDLSTVNPSSTTINPTSATGSIAISPDSHEEWLNSYDNCSTEQPVNLQ